jgi:hypothetical protein
MKNLAFFFILTLLASHARADVITQHQSDSLSQFQGAFAPLVFEKYSGPGTLVGVTLTENASIKNDFSIQFANATTISVSVTESIFGFAPVTISRSATSQGPMTIIPQGAVTPFSRTLQLNPKDFIGTGTYSIPVDSAAVSHFMSHNGNGYGSVLTFGQADCTLTYEFSPVTIHHDSVPEPSTYALAGAMGIAAMMGARWRLKRSV